VKNVAKDVPPASAVGESVGLEVFSADFARKLFDTLERRMLIEGRIGEWYEATFVELIERGESIHPVQLGDFRCMEVDTLEDLSRARELFG
jgi:choline kinase